VTFLALIALRGLTHPVHIMGLGGGIDAGAPLVDTLRRSTGLTGYTFYRWPHGLV